ncbi:hypothetical protein [Mitsuaria sp. GD03876]|uniref:hypothetical protein n=1 Tax=Mitsuaria sp. GD03876 TaxID=2975399 RepID=UPI00244A82A0|nr:hypothetical protein [Mitsuaria sp. GD03876]MDH0863553.1 hypothetical protein [Mitsuaria sp. GD03876]
MSTRRSPLWRGLFGACALLMLWLGLCGPAAAYDKWITTNPWLAAVGRLTPSSCSGAGVDSQYIRYEPGSDRGYDFPERSRDQLLALGNGACVGRGNGVGACQELSGWNSLGACVVTGDGSAVGTVKCPYGVTMKTYASVGGVCGALERTDELKDYTLQTGKHCQNIDSNGLFDATTRNCYCGAGTVFVPERGRCVETKDVLWIPHCDTCVGSAVYPAIGATVQRFDLGWQPWYGLSATFNSTRRIPYDETLGGPSMAPADPTTLGDAWTINLDRKIVRSDASGVSPRLTVARGGGFSTVFQLKSNGLYLPMQPNSLESVAVKPFGGWYYRDAAAGVMEVYDANGLLVSQQSIAGKKLTVVRSVASTPANVAPQPDLPIQLTDQDGRVVQLRYARPDPNGIPVLTQVIDPAGAVTSLHYTATSPRPTEIVHSDSTTTQFFYESANATWALTGFQNENGTRAGTYTYDAQGRATGSSRAGGQDAHSVTWAQPALWKWSEVYDATTGKVLRVHQLQPASGAVVTYPNGKTESIDATSSLDAVQWSMKTQQAGAGSPAATTSRAFDARGNVTRLDDYNGNRSCMSYETDRNLETVRVEGLGTTADCASVLAGTLPAGARKVSTKWHPVWRLPVRIAEPGRITTLVYNGQQDPLNGNAMVGCEASGTTLPDGSSLVVLCKRAEQATSDVDGSLGFAATPAPGVAVRTRTWTYNSVGQVLTERDPRGKLVQTSEYYTTTTVDYTKGDLKSTTNALGHKTTFPRYNGYGQPLEMVDANAVSTVYTYGARQRIATVTTAGATTGYEYWPTGELKRTTQSDGGAVNYEYDDVRRLTAVSDSLGNRIEYTLDASGQRTQEIVKDPQGTLKRSMNRVFDALGRAQQTTGRE